MISTAASEPWWSVSPGSDGIARAVRIGLAAGRGGDLSGRDRDRRTGLGARRPAGGRGRRACIRPSARDRPREARVGSRRARASGAAGRSSARFPGRSRLRARLRGEGRRIHPDHRRSGAAVLRFPCVQRAEAAGREGAWPRRDGNSLADGQCLPLPRAPFQVLRSGSRATRRGGARHGRAARHVRARLHGQVLRGHGLFRARQLLGQLQRPAAALHDRAAQRLAGDQLLLQHRVRRPQPVPRRRTVVTTGRLRPVARRDRPRLPLERLPRRHRSRKRLEPHGGARACLPREGTLLGRHCAPCHSCRGAEADQGDRLPHPHLGAHRPDDRVQRLLAPDLVRQPRRRGGVLGLPREGRSHGPLAAAQVRDPRTGRRSADAGDDDP